MMAKMETYGYARVSTTDQNLDLQEAALRAAGCTVIRSEKTSGTKRDGTNSPSSCNSCGLAIRLWSPESTG